MTDAIKNLLAAAVATVLVLVVIQCGVLTAAARAATPAAAHSRESIRVVAVIGIRC